MLAGAFEDPGRGFATEQSIPESIKPMSAWMRKIRYLASKSLNLRKSVIRETILPENTFIEN